MLTGNHIFEYISDVEWESIHNFAAKECIEIMIEEVDYFFSSREHLLHIFVEGMPLEKLNARGLQERFCKVFYSAKEVESLVLKIEKRVCNELRRSKIQASLNLLHQDAIMDILKNNFSFIDDEIKTLKLSSTTSKAIDMAWKKGSSGLLPKGLKRFSSQLRIGEYFLSTVGLSPKEVKESVDKKIVKCIRGILKQNRIEIANYLKHEIIAQVLKAEGFKPAAASKLEEIKTA